MKINMVLVMAGVMLISASMVTDDSFSAAEEHKGYQGAETPVSPPARAHGAGEKLKKPKDSCVQFTHAKPSTTLVGCLARCRDIGCSYGELTTKEGKTQCVLYYAPYRFPRSKERSALAEACRVPVQLRPLDLKSNGVGGSGEDKEYDECTWTNENVAICHTTICLPPLEEGGEMECHTIEECVDKYGNPC